MMEPVLAIGIQGGSRSLAAALDRDIRALPVQNTATMRAVRRRYSRALKTAHPEAVLDLAREMIASRGHRWLAYEIIAAHPGALHSVGEAELQEFGQGIDSWWTVDAFARTLSGLIWRNGQVSDNVIFGWARSPDRWWRRAALVSTVAFNMRSQGGFGDTARTLAVCRLLAADHDKLVAQAVSWALRVLVVHDPEAVRQFVSEHESVLAAQVKREVRNKLKTGYKNPKRNEGLNSL